MIDRFSHRAVLIVVALWPCLLACSAVSQPQLENEVRARIRLSAPLAQAFAALQATGFGCAAPTPGQDGTLSTSCRRTRAHRALASCVQSLRLTAAGGDQALIAVEVASPACAGLWRDGRLALGTAAPQTCEKASARAAAAR